MNGDIWRMRDVNRRDFLALAGRLTAAGLASLVVGRGLAAEAQAPAELVIGPTTVTLVDGTTVPAWSFAPSSPRQVPGPVLWATAGETVTLTVVNTLDRVRNFAIPGVVDSGPIPTGQRRVVQFTAPAAGTYAYMDTQEGVVGRVMGLHGAFIVMPASGDTPYSEPTRATATLFADLGDPAQLGGHAWDPSRQWIWLFAQIDTKLAQRVAGGERLTDAAFRAAFRPRYFTINGLSGFYAAMAEDVEIRGRIGEPALVRTMNVGLATHAPHIHGNHVYVVATDGRPCENVLRRDTWGLPELGRVDVLLPYEAPGDAHPWPPSDPFHFPMMMPMHCHCEMSQTAGGGSYPHGAVAHWSIEGL